MINQKTTTVLLIFLAIIVGACNFPSGGSGATNNETVCTDTLGRISKDDAIAMQDLYVSKLHRKELPNLEGVSYEDNREFLFDIDALKCYIEYVESYGAANGYEDLAIRVYLGAKDEGNGVVRTHSFLYGAGKYAGAGGFTQDDGGITPNLPGIDALNRSHSGMPPSTLKKP